MQVSFLIVAFLSKVLYRVEQEREIYIYIYIHTRHKQESYLLDALHRQWRFSVGCCRTCWSLGQVLPSCQKLMYNLVLLLLGQSPIQV